MDKKLINEDIQNIKYLLGYKPGRVISEQEQPELEESNPFRNNDGLENYNFPDKLKDRLSDIYDLLDEVMEDPDNDPSDYSDMYDFAGVVISQVIHKLRDEFGEDFEEYEDDVDDYLRNNEDETIFDFYNSRSDFDDDEDEYGDNLFEQEELETDRYMFFGNLEQIHRQTGILLEKDPEMISKILDNGHDWAQDHMSTAKESIDQVFDFLMNEEKGEEDIMGINEQEEDDYEEESVKSILKKHNLLDNVVEPDDSRILVRNQSSEVVQKILSLLPSFTELGFLAFIDCESADFSNVDICGLPNLAFINLNGTENNFEEQDYECANTEDSPFYFLE